jgi:hypothetical protein
MRKPHYPWVVVNLVLICLLFPATALAEDGVTSPAAEPRSPNGHLQSLTWLLGEWAGKTEDESILISAHWSDGGSSIVREFVVRSDGRETMGGTERIGWDAAAGKFRSWTFDSDGGNGEGHWERDGDKWRMEAHEVLPDGQASKTSIIITPKDNDHFVWQVEAAKVSDRSLPTMRVEFQRAAVDK